MDNPYSDPLGIEAEEREQTVISRLDGQHVLGAEQASRVLVDNSGGRSYHGVRRLVRGPDGRVTKPEETFACACGRELLSIHAVVFCTVCQFAICRTCAKSSDDGTTKLVRVLLRTWEMVTSNQARDRAPAELSRMAVEDLDRRSLAQDCAMIERYRLDLHRPEFGILHGIDTARTGDVRLWNVMRAHLARFRDFHTQYPFVVAPRGALDGRPFVTPLRQAADGQRLTLDDHELAAHVAVYGRSGGGKTTILQPFAHEAYRRGISVVTIEGKDDARYLATQYPETIIIGPHTPIPFLEPPSWLSVPEARSLLIKPLKQTMWGGEGLAQVATESHERTFANHARPSVRDWCEEARAMTQRSDTYTRRDRCEGLAQRLHRLVEQYPAIGTTPTGAGIPLEWLCTRPLLFSFGMHTEIEDYLTHWLLELRFGYNRAHHRRSLNTFVLLDESNLLVHDKTIQEEAPLATLFPLLREFGISVGLTASNYRAVPPTVRSSIFLQIATNLTDAREATEIARTFGCDEPQQHYHATRLGIGSAIARLGDRWKYPFIAQFEPLAYDKRVHPAAWQAALERTNALARTETLAAREGSNGQPTPAHAPSTSPPSRVAPVVEVPPNTKIALNKHATALLHDVADHPLTLSTPSYERCNLRLSEGDRAKTLLAKIGFLESHRVRTGKGRGKTGSALKLCAPGWNWLQRVPPKSTRGGDSIDHEFFVQHLARRIPRTNVETLGADLVISYNTTAHQQFHRALETLSDRKIPLNDGDLITLEVECSRPEITAPRNIARNAGFALTIIAVLDKIDFQRTIGQQERVVIVDVLRLLDALREEA